MLDINQIKDCIPHRFPFLLIDRILEIETGKRAVGIKNITANDYYCQYFSDSYLFSGALQVEAMAQVSAFIVMDMFEEKTRIPYFACIDGARFRKVVKPGDQLKIEVTLKKFKANTGKFAAKTYIDGELASEALITCMLAPA